MLGVASVGGGQVHCSPSPTTCLSPKPQVIFAEKRNCLALLPQEGLHQRHALSQLLELGAIYPWHGGSLVGVAGSLRHHCALSLAGPSPRGTVGQAIIGHRMCQFAVAQGSWTIPG